MKNLIVVALFSLFILRCVKSSCVMYGECNYDSTRDKRQNCYYREGEKLAAPLNKSDDNYEEAIKQVKSYCSFFFYDEEGKEKGIYRHIFKIAFILYEFV